MGPRQDFVKELQARGLVHQVTDQSALLALSEQPQTLYIGFDPTSSSLHVGSLLPAMTLRRFAEAGHRVIALVGGATGMVGDPSGKSAERKLLDAETLAANCSGLAAQLKHLVPGVTVLNNLDWFGPMGVLDFLRDVGKHFTVNHMMSKDSVRARLEDREQGISYTEFSYMLLQAKDFLHLSEHHGVRLQVGGSDQWGNITAGCELIRRTSGKEVFGMTHPLLLKSDGTKFGKSESGNVWLDPARTSAFEFYQFFLKTEDKDVIALAKQLSPLALEQIAELEREHSSKPEGRAAQIALARSMTVLVHGEAGLRAATDAAQALFSGEQDYRSMSASQLEGAFSGAPSSELARASLEGSGMELVAVLAETGLFAGKGAARKEISAGGVYLNGERVSDPARRLTTSDLVGGQKFIVLRKGKRTHHVLRLV